MTARERADRAAVLCQYRQRRRWTHNPIDAAELVASHYARCCAENLAAGRVRGARDDARLYIAAWTLLRDIVTRAEHRAYWVHGHTADRYACPFGAVTP